MKKVERSTGRQGAQERESWQRQQKADLYQLALQRERDGKDVQQVKVPASNRLLVLKYWSSQKSETSVFVGNAGEKFMEERKN